MKDNNCIIHKAKKIFTDGSVQINDLYLPQEHILKIVLNYQEIVELTCLNDNLEEFLIGFLFNERLIDNFSDIVDLDITKDEIVQFIREGRKPYY